MSSCCECTKASGSSPKGKLPLICMVPRMDIGAPGASVMGPKSSPTLSPATTANAPAGSEVQFLDENYIKKNFKVPQRSLYLDPFRRPLISFPMTQEIVGHFNLYRKTKINQQILDGFLCPSEAISAPSVFPYAKTEAEKKKESEDDEEIIYILQLPDWEFNCPVHNETIRTPRFIWHSCKKSKKTEGGDQIKKGGGPLNKPKPWLLSRHTDFDLLSQCAVEIIVTIKLFTMADKNILGKLANVPLARPGYDELAIAAPVLVQMNPMGKWENCRPGNMEEKQLKSIIEYIVNTSAISTAQSFCRQCAAENKTIGSSSYVPIVMMPINTADECPFDIDCEVKKIQANVQEAIGKSTKQKAGKEVTGHEDDKEKKKIKKKEFFLQRLTNFDLLSQW